MGCGESPKQTPIDNEILPQEGYWLIGPDSPALSEKAKAMKRVLHAVKSNELKSLTEVCKQLVAAVPSKKEAGELFLELAKNGLITSGEVDAETMELLRLAPRMVDEPMNEAVYIEIGIKYYQICSV
jgi:Tfp pilus assembly protein PilO